MKLCDTSVLVDIDRGGVAARVAKLDDEGRHAISTVTVTELRHGVNKRYDDESARRDALEDIERLLSRFEIVAVDRAVATQWATSPPNYSNEGSHCTTYTMYTLEQQRQSNSCRS
ncbi:type II toxin-antitoxin system VapC family toxin [Halomontanus rarus]|uniref:type II toxin-antitoxin system VapC family toxin n=1 Tax=Halomontanus rarus TaxID=3034020 RepID=UPI001F604B06